MFIVKTLTVIGFSLFLGSIAHAYKGVSLECTPETQLTSPVRVGWNTLVAIESVKTDFETLTLETRYLDSGDSNKEKSESATYDGIPQAATGMYGAFSLARGSWTELNFSSIGLGLRDIKSPPSAGPIAEGDHPATATLVLVSEFYPTVGAEKQIEVTKVNLSCLYKVHYPRVTHP